MLHLFYCEYVFFADVGSGWTITSSGVSSDPSPSLLWCVQYLLTFTWLKIVYGMYMSVCDWVLNTFVRWKNKKENVSVQDKTVSQSLKSNWQNPPVQKHWAAFVSSVLFNRLQPIDFCLDRFSLGRPSQCSLLRGSEMLLLRLFFFCLGDRFDTMRLFQCGIRAQHYPQMILSRALSSYGVETAPRDAHRRNSNVK